MTDSVQGEVIAFSDQDKKDLEALGIKEPANFHTVLEVWREVLKPAAEEATKKITPAWANRIVSSFKELTFADMVEFHDEYFRKLDELNGILLDEIASDEDCLTYATPEEDAAENSQHYKNLLRDWQMAVMQWELDWHPSDPLAAVKIAAISEVHRMFFGDVGLVPYLDNIKFEYTEDDQAELRAALEELREGANSE